MLEDLWIMRHNIRVVSTYPPRKCGLGIFSQNLLSALEDFAREVGDVKVTAIDKDGQSYGAPVDLVIKQYSPESWRRATREIVSIAQRSCSMSMGWIPTQMATMLGAPTS
jgi:hypothetical protein